MAAPLAPVPAPRTQQLDFHSTAPSPFVVPAGTTQIYDTDVLGTLYASQVTLESGSSLVVQGSAPLLIIAEQGVRLDGWIRVNGDPGISALHPDVGVLPYVDPWPGAPGQASGGSGASSSATLLASTPQGDSAPGTGGGRGGESGYKPSNPGLAQLGGNGGGGRFAADQLTQGGKPLLRLQATAGNEGAPTATSALSGTAPPQGGQPGQSPFVDGDPNNDFFGTGFDASTGQLIPGELKAPRGGFGGGAGGDAILSGTYPLIPWSFSQEWQGGPGGAGGGLVAVFCRQLAIGPEGGIEANGGYGGRGSFDPPSLLALGGCGGGGSGGMLLIQAGSLDLSQAQPGCLRALGGSGTYYDLGDIDAGPVSGNGGPGLIQVHVGSPDWIQTPIGVEVGELSTPTAKLLLPFQLN